MSTMRLTVLGSGTCAATAQRSMAGYLLDLPDRQVLLDIGDGALRRLLETGASYRDVDAIFISHLHADHVSDLVPFLWAMRYTPSFTREKPLRVFGPPGITSWYERVAAAFGEWLRTLPFPFEVVEKFQESWDYEGSRITTLPVRHGVTANGYRVEHGAHALAYSGDTGFCAEIVELARDADLLLLECSFPMQAEEMETHLRPDAVAKIAELSRARKIVLTHMYPECDQTDLLAEIRAYSSADFELAVDLRRYNI